MSKLYDLTQNYLNILELEDQLPEELLKEALENVEGDLQEKYENIGKLLAEIDASIAALKSEEDRLHEKRKVMENKKASIKDYAFRNLKLLNIPKLQTPLFAYSIKRNPGSVNIVNEELIPAEYYVTKFELSKKLMLEKLKNGEEVPGAELQQSESLMIK